MIGQLITSFLQGKLNLTTTSTIFSPYVDRVMEESRIAYFKELRGETLDTNRGGGILLSRRGAHHKRGGVMTVGVALVRTLNDLLPYSLRPIKAKRRSKKKRWGWGPELYYLRRRWHSHGKYGARRLVGKLQFWKR